MIPQEVVLSGLTSHFTDGLVSITACSSTETITDLLAMKFSLPLCKLACPASLNVSKLYDTNSISLGGLLLIIILHESVDFMNTIVATDDTANRLPLVDYDRTTNEAETASDNLCVEGLVLSSHATLLLHILADNSFTKLNFKDELQNLIASDRTHCKYLPNQELRSNRFADYISKYTKTNADQAEHNDFLDHWILEYLPKQSWWLPIRLLSAFAALQGQVFKYSFAPLTLSDCFLQM